MQSPVILPYQGKMPKIAADAFIAPNASIIGDVEIASQASVWFGCTLRGDDCYIRIGARSNIQDGAVIHVGSKPLPTIIGEDVVVGHLAMLHGCTIGNGTLIGMNATVLDGAVIEGGAIVAAGALVGAGKRVPSGELWAGTPARFVRKISDAEIADILSSSARYVEKVSEYRAAIRK